MIFKNYPFFPFLAPFTQTVGATTPKINTNLPFMVTNIMLKFHNNPSTTTQVIGRKPNFYDDDDCTITLYVRKIFLRS